MKTYFVRGAKWWDKVNGNTYCNAKIMDDNGRTLAYTGYTYGYGSHYLSCAKNWLTKNLRKNAKFNVVDLGADYTLKRIVRNNQF